MGKEEMLSELRKLLGRTYEDYAEDIYQEIELAKLEALHKGKKLSKNYVIGIRNNLIRAFRRGHAVNNSVYRRTHEDLLESLEGVDDPSWVVDKDKLTKPNKGKE